MEGSKQISSTGTKKTKTPFYDNIYFDSDDDANYEGEGDAKVQRHHAQPSNDDLLYDPDMDDDDQKWVDQQRQRQHGNMSQTTCGKNQGRNKKQTVPKSDAVLDCPACMTTLCFDCQRLVNADPFLWPTKKSEDRFPLEYISSATCFFFTDSSRNNTCIGVVFCSVVFCPNK